MRDERSPTAAQGKRRMSGAVFGLLLLQAVCTVIALGVLAGALTAGTWFGQTVTSAQRLTVWHDVAVVVACVTVLPAAALYRYRRALRIEGTVAAVLVLLLVVAHEVAGRHT
ncbi:hypothetical protein POF50_030170 [Streptomyces sp. SL13]|uniref:Uncharacterized protein n=1 Tax=Streptantibioticus silvisoli TaxID=2705255 RepID=A0AA90K143_9ACTN|nr:hypothetical protein [Streptantibioticus silvisoli]MDI5973556.1 hypothetical protein [Streptantibioticus silvisoli]